MKIALAGNPNSGKTTLFNAITGRIEHVGNWAGVTVAKKEGRVKQNISPIDTDITIVDLPGAYSMSPYTSEETITKDFILNENPDAIVNIVDATNLSRSLFLTTQLLELGVPVVVALNKSDLTRRKNTRIDVSVLSGELNCPVVETIALKNTKNGLSELVGKVLDEVNVNTPRKPPNSKNAKSPNATQSTQEADKLRYEFVQNVVALAEKRANSSEKQTRQDKLDRIVAHKWFGIPIFAAVIFLVFSISQSWLGPWLAEILVGWIDAFYALIEGMLGDSVNPVLSSLLLDGIIGGVGAVVGFLPLIMVLFFCLALLEDCGYMARVAVVMDRYFKKIGLSGRSIIPMIVGTGCAIPGIMSTRTIKDERQRRTTAMLTPFMPCGAKLPIIALFAGVFFAGQAWVGTAMYFLAIVVIALSGLIIKRITKDTSKSYFIMELPEYRLPSIKRATISMFSRAKSFIIKAGTIILVCNAVVQLLQTFNWQLQAVAESAPQTSILASLASPIALLFIPLGFGLWQFAAAAITGFIAKENVVGTLAVTFSVTNFIDVDQLALVGGVTEVGAVFAIGSVAALSYLVFNLFTPPCFAAIGAMNSELESKKWLFGAIGFQLGVGYTLSFVVYQVGTLITQGTFGLGFAGGLAAVSLFAGIVTYLAKAKKHSRQKYIQKKVA